MSDLISREAVLDALEWKWAGKAAIDAIKNLPSAQQWIPCSRELPKNMGTYWVTVDDYRSNERVTKLREYLGNENWERDGYEPPLTWMPLNTPEPWKGEER